MEHVIGIPHECHISFLYLNLLRFVTFKVPSGNPFSSKMYAVELFMFGLCQCFLRAARWSGAVTLTLTRRPASPRPEGGLPFQPGGRPDASSGQGPGCCQVDTQGLKKGEMRNCCYFIYSTVLRSLNSLSLFLFCQGWASASNRVVEDVFLCGWVGGGGGGVLAPPKALCHCPSMQVF